MARAVAAAAGVGGGAGRRANIEEERERERDRGEEKVSGSSSQEQEQSSRPEHPLALRFSSSSLAPYSRVAPLVVAYVYVYSCRCAHLPVRPVHLGNFHENQIPSAPGRPPTRRPTPCQLATAGQPVPAKGNRAANRRILDRDRVQNDDRGDDFSRRLSLNVWG